MNSANYHGLIEVNCITPQPSKLVLNSKNSSKSFQKAKTHSNTPSYRSFERNIANPLHKKPHIFQNTKS